MIALLYFILAVQECHHAVRLNYNLALAGGSILGIAGLTFATFAVVSFTEMRRCNHSHTVMLQEELLVSQRYSSYSLPLPSQMMYSYSHNTGYSRQLINTPLL
jgi:hypothetical protein